MRREGEVGWNESRGKGNHSGKAVHGHNRSMRTVGLISRKQCI